MEGVQVLIVICLLLTTAICCWRFYLRLYVTRQHPKIEISLLAGLIFQIALGIVQIQLIKLSVIANSPQDMVVVQKYSFTTAFMYFGSLWSVKISVNLLHLRLTCKFPGIYVWAVRSLWFLVVSLPIMYVMYTVTCLPVNRQWDAPLGLVKPCHPMTEDWAFWTPLAIHILSDIWLCAIPFHTLIHLQEKRLRVAVSCIYSLTLASIIVSTVRAILLGLNAQHNLRSIISTTMIEVSTIIVVGSIPGISSGFTRKYVYGNSNNGQILSLQPWTGTAASHQQQPSGTLNQTHDFNKFSGSVEEVELRDTAQSVGAASTMDEAAEDDVVSADRAEKAETVVVRMV